MYYVMRYKYCSHLYRSTIVLRDARHKISLKYRSQIVNMKPVKWIFVIQYIIYTVYYIKLIYGVAKFPCLLF